VKGAADTPGSAAGRRARFRWRTTGPVRWREARFDAADPAVRPEGPWFVAAAAPRAMVAGRGPAALSVAPGQARVVGASC